MNNDWKESQRLQDINIEIVYNNAQTIYRIEDMTGGPDPMLFDRIGIQAADYPQKTIDDLIHEYIMNHAISFEYWSIHEPVTGRVYGCFGVIETEWHPEDTLFRIQEVR